MKYFLMSTRFNKKSPGDFGLENVDGKYIRKSDGSEWVECSLYDYGWGNENGFYRKPLGSFNELIKIVINDNDLEDTLGAAAIIDKLYQNDLKVYLLSSMSQNVSDTIKKKLCEIFHLKEGFNRTFAEGMTLADVKKEYDEWTKIADFYSK